jgi:hypothetical protein
MGKGVAQRAWALRDRVRLPHASGIALTLLTHLCLFGSACHVVCLVQREHARAVREYTSAATVYQELCSDAVKKESYGRFHLCDEAVDALSISNVWLVAFDRAIAAFVRSIKTQTFEDLTHIGLISVLTGLCLCCAMHVGTYLLERWNEWGMMRREYRGGGATGKHHTSLKMD